MGSSRIVIRVNISCIMSLNLVFRHGQNFQFFVIIIFFVQFLGLLCKEYIFECLINLSFQEFVSVLLLFMFLCIWN